MKTQIFFTVLLSLAASTFGDVLILKNGQVITGTVLKRDADGILIKLNYGTFTYPESLIKEVQKEEQPPGSSIAELPEETERIPRWGKIITPLAKKSWAYELKQIPATVIDKGMLMNVPYMSFRPAYGYELNIYGDPDNPAGIEIGVQHYLLHDDSAKSNCLEFISSLLPRKADRVAIAKLNWRKDLVTVDGVTFEITPPTDEDAYGGWWISIYNKELLKKAPASKAELREITEFKPPQTPQPVQYKQMTAESSGPGAGRKASTWTPVDYSNATLYRGGYSGGGTVYVHGYYRKNGTYVNSYTRHAPRR